MNTENYNTPSAEVTLIAEDVILTSGGDSGVPLPPDLWD